MVLHVCSVHVGSLPLAVHLSEAGVGEHELQIRVTDTLSLQDHSTLHYAGKFLTSTWYSLHVFSWCIDQ